MNRILEIGSTSAVMLLIACGGDKTTPMQPPERTVASISVSPNVMSVADGATAQLQAALADQDDEPFTSPPAGVTVMWTSADEAVASVDGDGTVTGNQPGETEITATASGRSDMAVVTVTQVAAALTMTGGDAQHGDPGSALAEELVVRVTDRHGDPVAGVEVAWTITAGGGALAPATSTTDTDGHARTVWTLGSTPGANTAEASVAGLSGSPVGFTAGVVNQTPIVAISAPVDGSEFEQGQPITFTGTAADAEDGALTGDALVWWVGDEANGEELGRGTSITASNLQVGQHAVTLMATDNGGAIGTAQIGITINAIALTCSDTVAIADGGTLAGDLPSVTVTGAVTASATASICGDLTVNGSGVLDVAAHTIDVAGTFRTAQVGKLKMQDPAGLLRVAGDVELGGGDTNGLLSAGTIEVAGNFTQRRGRSGCCNTFPRSFQASGTHTVVLNGTTAQTVDFNSAGLAADESRFASLRVENPGTVHIVAAAVGNALDVVAATSIDGAGVLAVGGPLITAMGSTLDVDQVRLEGPMAVAGSFSPDSVWFDGSGQQIQGGLDYVHVIVRDTVAFAGNAILGGNLAVRDFGSLAIGAHTVDVAGGFSTASSAVLTMQDGAGVLRIGGSAEFGGSDTNGMLTAGTIEVGGDFIQRQGRRGCCLAFPRSFHASGTHLVVLNGTAAQIVDFNSAGLAADRSRFHALRIDNSTNVNIVAAAVGGALEVTAATAISGTGALEIAGSLETAAGSALNVDRVLLHGAMSVSGTFSPDTVWFDGSGQSIQGGLDYQDIVVRDTATFGGDATLSGSIAVTDFGLLDIAAHTVDVAGGLLTANSAALKMQNPAALLRVAGSAEFGGTNTNGLLTAGTIEVGGNFTQRQGRRGCCLSFPGSFQASGAHTVVLNGAAAQSVDFNSGGLAADRARFHDLLIDNTAGVTFAGSPAVGASLDLIGTMTVPADVSVDIQGTLFLRATAVLNNDGTVEVGACTTEAGHTVSGTNPCVP